MQFMRNLLSIMSHKTILVKQKLRIISQRTIRARLMLYLRTVANRLKTNEFNISYDRQALADYLCVDRSALSAELSKLKTERVLDFDKNHFCLCVLSHEAVAELGLDKARPSHVIQARRVWHRTLPCRVR